MSDGFWVTLVSPLDVIKGNTHVALGMLAKPCLSRWLWSPQNACMMGITPAEGRGRTVKYSVGGEGLCKTVYRLCT